MRFAFPAVFFAVASPALSQVVPVGTWSTYASVSSASAMAVASDGLYVATSGGLVVYPLPDGDPRIVTNVDGLTSIDLTAVGTDARGNVWVGGSGGELDVRSLTDGSWRAIDDIRSSSRIQKSIRGLVAMGDTMFVVSDFGVSVFRVDRWEFADTYANFGFVSTPRATGVAVLHDSLWIATTAGLVVGWLGSPNLSSPDAWTTVPGGSLPSTDIRALGVIRDTLLVATAQGLAVKTSGGFVAHASYNARDVVRLRMKGDALLTLVVQFGQSVAEELPSLLGPPIAAGPVLPEIATDIATSGGGSQLWMATVVSGTVMLTGGAWEQYNPDAPSTSLFSHITVDDRGVVWTGTGINGGGKGFMRFDPRQSTDAWKTFSINADPSLASNDYYKVQRGANGSMWAVSWGFGIVEIQGDSIVRRLHSQSVPALASSLAGSPMFVVTGGAAGDADGNTWITNRTAVTGKHLVQLGPDGSVTYHSVPLPGASGFFATVVVDRNGTKWIANSEPVAKATTGLYYFNEALTVSGTVSTGGWGSMSEADGLADNAVMTIAEDLEGDIWVGTDLGVTIITNSTSPRTGRLSSFPLREQSIQTIAVDAINRKWVGTKEGVFLVNADGSQLVSQYTKRNTDGMLLSDDVRSIALDNVRGVVYVGTEKGLSALWIAAVETQKRYTTLVVGPNPFVIPSAMPMTVRNLVQNSVVKILRLDGTLVRMFDAQGGGRAFWDGADEAGVLVGTGVYIIVAFAENGEEVATGKVAVVRR